MSLWSRRFGRVNSEEKLKRERGRDELMGEKMTSDEYPEDDEREGGTQEWI